MASNNSNVILSYIQQPLQSPAHNSVSKSSGGVIIKSKDYELNHHQKLIKKRKHCDRPFMNIIPKDGGRQLKIECSAGCFELLKAELKKLALDQELSKTFRIACIVEKSVDVAGNLPQITIKVHSLRKNGTRTARPKFTINIYNTQCSLLINGACTQDFQDEILPEIIKNLEQNPNFSSLDRTYAAVIDRCLEKSITEQVVQDRPSLGHPAAESSNVSDVCAHCQSDVTDGIACDGCGGWFHYECEQLGRDFKKFYEDGASIPYSCLSCRHLSILSPHYPPSVPAIVDDIAPMENELFPRGDESENVTPKLQYTAETTSTKRTEPPSHQQIAPNPALHRPLCPTYWLPGNTQPRRQCTARTSEPC